MKHTFLTRAAAMLLAFLIAFALIGCGKTQIESTTAPVTESTPATTAEWTRVGEGNCAFPFIVTFADDSKQEYVVSTDKETLGAALLDAGLIAGENSEYGLFVKSVCGVTADYDTDKTYWALYVNDELSPVGVDSVKCTDVAVAEFRLAK